MGSIHFDKKGRRWLVSIYWEKKRYRIFQYKGDPIWAEKTARKLLGIIQGEIEDKTFHPKTYFPDSPLSTSEYAQRWLCLIKAKSNTIKDYKLSITLS